MKLAILSHILPPAPSGQSVVLYRLLSGMRGEDYCLVSSDKHNGSANAKASLSDATGASKLSGHYHLLPEERELTRPTRWGGLRARKFLNVPLRLVQRARNLAGIVKRERHTALVACSGDPLNLPAAYLASRIARVRFYAYIFDDYLYQWTQPLYHFWARRFEPMMLKGADGVIVPNEFLRDEYCRRYHIDSTVIHNPCELHETDANALWPSHAGEIRIAYTGAIYHAHYDAFRRLMAAIKQLENRRVSLHLYTAQPRDQLEREGISGPIVFHEHLSLADAIEVQRQADILFLPLAFNSPIPEVIRTSAPGKMGEYLASGRPVLAHVPAGSFVEWYFQSKGCGIVVTQDCEKELARAIRRVIDDAALRQTIVANARACAETDFDLALMRTKFQDLLRAAERER